jgi:4-amino-4-deoxy-L-arabinose transferase-like glycosyltransferase
LDLALLGAVSAYLLVLSAIMPMNFDEAYNLQAPIMIAREGRYETIYHLRSFDAFTTLTLGPTVQLPIALGFKLFGIGLLTARFVLCLYVIGLICMLWIQCVRSYGRVIGLAVLLTWFSLPDQIGLSLTVIGEVPAIFFIWLGMLLWTRGTTRYQNIGILVMGFSVVTKLYFGLVLLPVTILITIQAAQTRTSVSSWIRQMVTAAALFLVPALIWEAVKFLYLGSIEYRRYLSEYLEFLDFQRRQSDQFSVTDRLKIFSDNTLPELNYWVMLAVVVAAAASQVPNLRRCTQDASVTGSLSLLIFITALVWFLFIFPLAWWRYLFAFSTLFLFLLGGLLRKTVDLFHSGRGKAIAIAALGFLVVLFVMPGVIRQFQGTRSFYAQLLAQKQFASTVDSYMRRGYSIGVHGWWQAPEISFLAGGAEFLPFTCGQQIPGKLLVLSTKLEAQILPESASALRQCLGELINASADQEYSLYIPLSK